ncbi:twin-arginine translocase subunit TatC [Gammaproteobacteria bacterium]|nr:twin-arginine translocase subunit TatC [Gammaproteobacteria bacterium]
MTKESISSHFIELRTRLLRVLGVMAALTLVGLPFASEIYSFVSSPLINALPAGSTMIATEVTTPFMVPIKLTIFSAMLLTAPYMFYEVWMFMIPGLFKSEKQFVGPLMLSTIALFLLGIAFAYFIVAPIIFSFFIGSAPDSIKVMTDINQYFGFFIKLIFAFGISFEIPVATFLLISSGIVGKASLIKARPYIVIMFFVVAMFLTPPDVFSQLFLAIPMWLLFEIGLLISKDKES